MYIIQLAANIAGESSAILLKWSAEGYLKQYD
jgi:hypothetical protein